MKSNTDSIITKVKKLKLAKNRKPSDVFQMYSEPFKRKERKNAPPIVFLKEATPVPIHDKRLRKLERRERRNQVLAQIKERFPFEVAAKIKKKERRKMIGQFTGYEFQIFSWWCKRCKNQNRPKNRNPRRREKGKRTTYEIFINSKEWAERKNIYYQTHPRVCAACGSYKFIHLHHMVYGQFGKELDEHLIPLCKTHHDQYHAKNGTKRHMIRETMAFIEKIRVDLLPPQPHQ